MVRDELTRKQKQLIANPDSENRHQSSRDRFKTMKKIISLTPPDTPPPSFIPPTPPVEELFTYPQARIFEQQVLRDRAASEGRPKSRDRTDSVDPKDVHVSSSVRERRDGTSAVTRKKHLPVDSSNNIDFRIEESPAQRRRKSPDNPKWNVPNQIVELRSSRDRTATSRGSVKPPTNTHSDPYQVKLVKKDKHPSFTNRTSLHFDESDGIGKPPIAPSSGGAGDQSESRFDHQPKQSSRRHKREQEKQQLDSYFRKTDRPDVRTDRTGITDRGGTNHERVEIREHHPSRKSRQERLDKSVRNSVPIDFEMRIAERAERERNAERDRDPVAVPPSTNQRDEIHARIELRPDGSQNRSSFIKMHSAIGKQHFDPTFKSGRDSILAPANLHRSDSIRLVLLISRYHSVVFFVNPRELYQAISVYY